MMVELSYSFGFDAHDFYQDSTLDMMIDYSFGFDDHVFYQGSTLDMMDMMIDSYEKRRNFVVVAAAAIVGVSVLVIFGFVIVAAAAFG